MVVLQELYMYLMSVSSTCSIDSSWVSADGCWSRKHSNCCVLVCCLVKAFQWHSRCPRETCTVMIQEWHVGYACRLGWKMIDSPNSFPSEFVVGVSINRVLYCRGVVVIYSAFLYWIHKFYGRKICRVINIFLSSTKLCVYIPEFYGWFRYDIRYIAGSYFSSSLVFDMYEMSIVLNADNSISRSPF